jgi:uncharacterized flavoprotein (TIGR03862 family)
MNHTPKIIAIIGAGPAGLFAAEYLASRGHTVTVCDRMPSPGRKFLMAGRGGLNLTHSEALPAFLHRYDTKNIAPSIESFTPEALRAWCEALGQKTFVGSSGRVFPESFKASPLLRAWLARLDALGVRFAFRHHWKGWKDDALVFDTPDGIMHASPDATILALGGASWPRLGSDGSWTSLLEQEGVEVKTLRPANCGFHIAWSEMFRDRFAGTPLKPVTLSFRDQFLQGEAMIAKDGLEGSAVYALSAGIRAEIESKGSAALILDLRPGMDVKALEEKIARPRGRNSLSNHLRRVGLSPVIIALLHEAFGPERLRGMAADKLARAIKSLRLTVDAPFSIDRAISSAGGVSFASLDENLMLMRKPGVFVAGEMLDWEAPTGGYLLQGCFATGLRAAQGVEQWANR